MKTQPRQPAGRPEGGEFLGHIRDEDRLELTHVAADTASSAWELTLTPTGVETAKRRIEQANKRLERAGIDDRFTYEIEETVRHDERTGLALERYVLRIDRPRIGYDGWEFVAAYDRTAEGDILCVFSRDTDVDAPADLRCEQCESNRRRDRIYLIRHEDGRTMQVGKSCLELSMGVAPKGLWALDADLGIEAEDTDDLFGSLGTGARHDTLYPAEDLIATALAASNGGEHYVPRSRASMQEPATFDRVAGNWMVYAEQTTDADRKLARDILTWLAQQPDDGDYISKLRTALAVNSDKPADDRWVRAKHGPLATSAISAYQRAQEQKVRVEVEQKKRAEFKQSYVAPVGERVRDVKATVLRTRFFSNDFGGKTMVELATDDGHVMVWWASGDRSYKPEDEVMVTATVKDHEVYRDTFQTVVTRAKLTDPETGIEMR